MIIERPKVKVPRSALDKGLLARLERYARVCYKSEEKMIDEANHGFLRSILQRGHESIIEHEKITVLMVVDRGISHEIVRHRIAAYSQESTRYCNYARDRFGNEITVIEPFYYIGREQYQYWKEACLAAEKNYLGLIRSGSSSQEARAVLPHSLKTEIVITYNLREWRHFFTLRCAPPAHPQMRQITIPLLRLFQQKIPLLFDDIKYDQDFPAQHYAEIELTDDLFFEE